MPFIESLGFPSVKAAPESCSVSERGRGRGRTRHLTWRELAAARGEDLRRHQRPRLRATHLLKLMLGSLRPGSVPHRGGVAPRAPVTLLEATCPRRRTSPLPPPPPPPGLTSTLVGNWAAAASRPPAADRLRTRRPPPASNRCAADERPATADRCSLSWPDWHWS